MQQATSALRHHRRQRGSALMIAMLVVAVVAALSARAYWKQTQAWAVEQAEQQRLQSQWLLTGALDWARLILREDARASNVDHLGEPWALPLEEARVSTFIAADGRTSSDVLIQAFLAGRVTDQQGRMNLRNLMRGDESRPIRSVEDVAAFQKLFAALNLPAIELERLTEQLLIAYGAETETPPSTVPLPPMRYEQLGWLGLSARTLSVLAPHTTWLPERTPLNVNTAPPIALYASVPGMDFAQAQQLVGQRQRNHFKTLADAQALLGALGQELSGDRFSVTSQYFLVQGRLRWDDLTVYETSLLRRDGVNVRTVWRQRGQPNGATVTAQ